MYQTLVGDSTDNYKGCPAVGAKTADKLLQDNGATWQTVVDAYAAKGLGEEIALENAGWHEYFVTENTILKQRR